MSFLDKAKEKAAELAAKHPDKAEMVSDKVIGAGGDALDKATGGKFADKIDDAQRKADDTIGQ